MKTRGLLALSPMILFLVIYVGISLIIDDFYKIPISVALLFSTFWAMLIVRRRTFTERVEIFAKEAGNPNVLYMIWIFILAGVFANIADKTGGVDATVALTMSHLPSYFVVPGLFVAACLISLAIGTSVGTVVALTPFAIKFAAHSGVEVAFLLAVIIGGAFFGDNLSFISDTTIAATRTQGCLLKDKFKANLRIVLPAAIFTLGFYIFSNYEIGYAADYKDVNYWLVTPYLSVIVLAIMGVQVTLTLLTGIGLSIILALFSGFDVFSIIALVGDGINEMGNLIIITLLATGMLGLIKEAGGIEYLIRLLSGSISGQRGAKGAIALLVSIVNLCTANNTVAILTVGSISKDISQKYSISSKTTASLLDTASCIVQCLIPYGAQILIATTLADIDPTAPWKYLVYPWALLISLLAFIVFRNFKVAQSEPMIASNES